MAGERVSPFGLAAVAVAVVAVVTSTTRPVPGGREAATVADTGYTARGGVAAVLTADSAARNGRDLLHDFFGVQDQRGTAVADTFGLGVLIATVPDPYDSHLDWSFDADLEAIRRAFETSDYVVDRFWLPGPRDSVAPVQGRPRVPLRELRPGVMLFRRVQPGAPILQLLYLIPELPTRGIYKEAMRAALEERQLLLHPDRASSGTSLPLRREDSAPIRIVGPTFSGGALSLRFALQDWLADRLTDSAEVISGSATSLTNQKTLELPRVHFHATLNPDQGLDRVLVDTVLPCLGLLPSQVAVLQESSTQYGQGLLDVARHESASAGGTASRISCSGPRPQTARDSQFVVIPFPMSISSLRGEYQRVPAEPASSPTLPTTEAPRLPLDLLDPSRPKEDLPVSSRLTPVALDLLLDEVARTLTRREVKLVGLLATDVRDKLFLGDEIRKRVRDVQFFTYESNVLYLRSDRSEALRGMLVLSTYPLILENQWITSDRSATRRFAFGSDGAQGVYNATLLQLGQARELLDYRRGRRARSSTPPVWITTVGNRTFLPVAAISDTALAGGYLAPGCAPGQECVRAPSTWPRLRLSFLALATIMLASFALLLLGLRGLITDRELSSAQATRTVTSERERLPLADQVMAGSLKLHDRLYRLLRLVSVTGIFLAASAPVLPLARYGGQAILILVFVLVFAAAVVGLAALMTGCVTLGRTLRGLASPGWRYFVEGPPWTVRSEKWTWRLEVLARVVVALFGVIYFGLSLGFAREIVQLPPPNFWMFFRRAIEVDSLVSPVLPLVLGGIGYAVWCTWHIERIALLRYYTTFESACEEELGSQWAPRMTFRSALRDDLRRSGAIARTIRNRLFQVIPSLGALGILAAFLCVAWWLSPQFGRSFEAMLIAPRFGSVTAFDLLFRATVLASMFATAWGACRLVVVWAGLRDCLAGFARMPIVTAFDRLPPRVARLTRLRLPGPSSTPVVGAVADVQWLHLQRIHAGRKTEFAETLGTDQGGLAPRIEKLMQAPATLASDLDWSGRSALVERFASLHELLRELWRLEPMPQDIDALISGLGKEAERGDAGEPTTSTTQRIRRAFAGPVRLWLRAAEEYTASRMVEYVEWVIRHLRILALFMLLSLLLTTLLVSSYPYQPQSLLRLILLLVLVGTVGAVVVVLVQMNRNEVLSRIARTEPGRITWNATFVLNLFTFGVVPLLTLLSSEFPGLRNVLFAWVQPLVKALARQ